jgi:phosphoribosyl-ATP pyrophosphohydrolase
MAKPTKKGALKPKPGRTQKKGGAKRKPARSAIVPPAPVNTAPLQAPPPESGGVTPFILDRLWSVVMSRRTTDPMISHSARLLSRGTAKIAQKFGEEAVECLIEAALGNRRALVGESADVLYHLIVMWVDAGVRPEEVWAELRRREGVSGIAEKAARTRALPLGLGVRSTKIP